MKLFGKKKKNKQNPEKEMVFRLTESPLRQEESEQTGRSYKNGIRTAKDMFAPDAITVVDEKTLKVGDNYIRNYVMQGYPNAAYVGWLDRLYSYQGDLDTMVYFDLADDRSAADELTRQITALMAQLANEQEKGSIANITKYQARIAQLEEERAAIELNRESLYGTAIFANLLCQAKDDLDKKAEMLESGMKGQRASLIPTTLRMVDGYRSALPVMYAFYDDKLRNFNTGAVVGCFPFYNSEICQPGGLLIGINNETNTPLQLDFYNKNYVNNTNISVFGRSGSGKTYMVSLMTMRSALMGISTAIIDPDGEYGQIARKLGGLNIEIRPGSKYFINAFDVDEAEEVDEDGNPTGTVTVDLRGKIADLLDLISVMAKGEITQEQRSLVSGVLQKLYQNFGITEEPSSLYISGTYYDEEAGQLKNGGRRRKMPTFSDFHKLLEETIQLEPTFAVLQPLANQLKMFCKGGPYDLFDCETTIDATRLTQVPVVNFDIHTLEEGTLRPIGMYIAMTYIWEKFVKKNYKVKKRVVCDEAWMMLNKGMPGYEYTAQFLEKCARRIRKRNAGLLVASQNFVEFTDCTQGKAVLSNTAVRIFLKQNEVDLHAIQSEFHLSDGETEYLKTADTGEFLLKMDGDSTVGTVLASPYEHDLIVYQSAVMRN